MDRSLTNELLELLEKARAGDATGDDYSRIAAIINRDHTGELIAQADHFLAQENPVSSQHIEPYDHEYWQQAFLEIKQTWQQQHIQPVIIPLPSGGARGGRRLPLLRRWWAAASIIGLLAIGSYFFFIKKKPAAPVTASTEILPGKDGAILTLANGSQILLDSIQNGVVTLQGGTTARIVNDTLIYEGKGSVAVYNVMSTPKARKFHLILPDGTKAWLNSASSIRYPTAFTGNERQVSVTGEVYFEVAAVRLPAKGGHAPGLKMPFKVNVNDQADIEVLGTHFNVKAYDNEPVINTTLLEGSVRIVKRASTFAKASADKENAIILKPGQQAQILVGEKKPVNGALPKDPAAKKTAGPETKPGVTVINNSNIEKVMAWKNGVFDFNNIAFDDAMYQLERWYDIEVVYEKGIPTDVELSGKITKDNKLNDVVVILEKIGVKCRLEGRKLVILS